MYETAVRCRQRARDDLARHLGDAALCARAERPRGHARHSRDGPPPPRKQRQHQPPVEVLRHRRGRVERLADLGLQAGLLVHADLEVGEQQQLGVALGLPARAHLRSARRRA